MPDAASPLIGPYLLCGTFYVLFMCCLFVYCCSFLRKLQECKDCGLSESLIYAWLTVGTQIFTERMNFMFFRYHTINIQKVVIRGSLSAITNDSRK